MSDGNITVLEFSIIPVHERYYSDESSWGIFNFTTKDDIPHYNDYFDPLSDRKVSQKMSSIVGKMQKLYLGSEYKVRATCEWNNKYSSYQYVPISIIAVEPKTFEAQELFLKSLVSETIAKNILDEYPNVIEEVMNGQCQDLDYDKIKGLGKKSWDRLRNSIIDNYVISDIITMLQPLGVTYNMIKKLLNEEPNPALLKEQLKKNPYMMTKIRGLGFKRVDDLSLKLKPELKTSMYRLVAYVDYFLKETGENDGHTWVTKDILAGKVSDNVPECIELLPKLFASNSFLYMENDKVGLLIYRELEKRIFEILVEKSNFHNDKFDFSDKEIELGITQAEDEQGFIYSDEQKEAIISSVKGDVAIISGKAGCVDCDTEFFNGIEWKKISEYSLSDKVLQYNKDGTTELVYPSKYIKRLKDYLWHFETKYGLDQCLSEDHNCIIRSQKGIIKEESFGSIMKRQNALKFYDSFITTFSYEGLGIDLSDNMIRLLIAASGDASYNYNANPSWSTYNRARFRIKKARKISRLITIIKELSLDYEIKTFANDDHVNVYVYLPYRIKEFPKDWYNCSKHQLEIIAEEVMYWDGDFGRKNRYSTTIKNNADFIQFVFSSLGKRANIFTNDRRGRKRTVNGKDYETKSIEYSVSISDRTNVSLCCDRRKNHTPTTFEKYKTKDGYEYCFTVPSHVLVLRRNNKIFITGNCGKTTIKKAIYKIYKNKGFSIMACALSAKAAQRITEATEYPASTIHRTLGAQGLNEFSYNNDNPLPTDVVDLDEASMVNARLFYNLLCAVNIGTRLIISGDHMQLPPIGYGNVFSDMLSRVDMFNSKQLTKPMRQAEMSGILSDANMIRDGINPISSPELKIVHGELQDMFYMFRENRESLQNIAIKTYLKSIEADGIDEVVIAVPRKQDCINSSFEINKKIQDELFRTEKRLVDKGYIKYRLGAKVMQTVNNYDKNVFNGEIGYITNIHEKYDGGKKKEYCEITYKDALGKNKVIEYGKNELDQIDLAYAMTVHKLQGSGYKTVIGIIDNTHYTLLDNCMLYTLITRAKKRCLLLAEPNAFLKCIRTNHNTTRQTWLKEIDVV